MTNPLFEHTKNLTPDAKRSLALAIGTTPAGLHQLAHAYRTSGKLSLTPDLAARVEAATGGAVLREQCCVACGRCELAEKARGSET
jgi:hypothetical protein